MSIVSDSNRIRMVKIGDRVTLNSGGPIMTVVDMYGPVIVAAWRVSDGEVMEHSFDYRCLSFAKDNT